MLDHFKRKKEISHAHSISELHRSMSALDLTLMGIGAIIGAGVFVLTGIAAATQAGPGVVISYMVAGLVALFAALAYAELASSVGGTGSAYSYAYAGFGELIAWIIGWNLLLEYIMSIATVAIGWSGYVNNFLQTIHVYLPSDLTKGPFDGGLINFPAFLIIILLGVLLSLGARHGVRFNAAMVFVKLLTIAFFIGVSLFHIDFNNWKNFLPYGWSGVMHGASLVFFAYIGFDALSTTVEETVNPQRNVPIGIIASLIVCTLIYMIVSALLTLIVPYPTLNVQSPVSDALLQLGNRFAAGVIAAGAIAGLTTVMLVMYYGLARICLAIARDGLIPKGLAKIHPQTFTPIRAILLTGILCALIAGFVPIHNAAELVNIGTLTAFSFVCGGVVVLRYSHPDLPRPFKLPFSPFIPILGVIFCVYLMINLSWITWYRFIIWTIIGIIIYLFYGQKYSVLGQQSNKK